MLEQKIAHSGNPVLRLMMDNIVIRQIAAGNKKADKSKSTEKIDGFIATIMALDRAIRCENAESESVFDERAFIVLTSPISQLERNCCGIIITTFS